MNVEAFYASRQLQLALDLFSQGRCSAGCEAVVRAKMCIDRFFLKGPAGPAEEPHAEQCGCQTCYEALLERL